MEQLIVKNDWFIYQRLAPRWQERYMEQLVEQYKCVLNSTESAFDKFWKIYKRISLDKSRAGVVMRIKKSTMLFEIGVLLREHVITFDDLKDLVQSFKTK